MTHCAGRRRMRSLVKGSFTPSNNIDVKVSPLLNYRIVVGKRRTAERELICKSTAAGPLGNW